MDTVYFLFALAICIAAINTAIVVNAKLLIKKVGKITKVKGGEIHWVESGQGRPIIMIHGLAGNLRNFTFALTSKLNKEFKVIEIRGNVDTRIRKMHDGHCQGLIMAAAGIERLGLQEHISEYLNETQMLTAPGQGAIAIEIREDDNSTLEFLSVLNHKESVICVTAERSFLNRLEGGCQIPFAAHATLDGDHLVLEGLVATLDGRKMQRETIKGDSKDAIQLGIDLANSIKNNGGYEILEEIKKELS